MSEENSTVAKSIRLIVQKLDTYTSATKKKFFEIEEILESYRQEIDQLKGKIESIPVNPAPTSISSEQLDPIMERLTVLENKIASTQQSIPSSTTIKQPSPPTSRPNELRSVTPPSAPPSRISPVKQPSTPPVIPPPRSPTPVSTSNISSSSSPSIREPSLPSTPQHVKPVASTLPPKKEPETPISPAKSDDETSSLMDALKKLDSL